MLTNEVLKKSLLLDGMHIADQHNRLELLRDRLQLIGGRAV
jgi:hypothetical protein